MAVLAWWGRQPPTPLRRLAVWSLFLLVTDLLEFVAGAATGNNLWLEYVVLPLELCFTLWILAAWQPDRRWSRRYEIAIPVIVAVVAVLLLAVDPAAQFYLWIGPVLSLVAVLATMLTLIPRSLLSRTTLTNQDWFWVCLGLALFWACFAPVPPFMQAFLGTRTEWVVGFLLTRAWLTVAAFLLITWGVFCQRLPVRLPGRS